MSLQRSLFRHWITIDVRWGDMDAFQHVNNATYVTYMEQGRVAYFDALNLWGHSIPATVGPAVVHVACNYRRQVRYPARLEIGTRTRLLRPRRLELETGIFLAGEDTLVADGVCTTVWVDYVNERAIGFPGAILAAVRDWEGALLEEQLPA